MHLPSRVRGIELPQFDLLNEMAARRRAAGADVISLGQALPGFPPPPAALEAFRSALDDESAHVYSGVAGLPELRRALAVSLEPLGARIDPDREIVITTGGNQAFLLALMTLVDPGDEVVLLSPYFLNHEMAVRAVGAIPVEAPVPAARGFRPQWDDVAPHVTERTRAVIVVSPSNPTGAVVDPSNLAGIVERCAARGVIVFVDETYLRFTYDSAPATALAIPSWRDNVVVIGSFSKQFAITGWRCGYLIAPHEVVAQALKIQDSMVICAPVPVQRAVATVLAADPEHARQWLPELRARRDLLVQRLARIPGVTPVVPGGGFFVMARLDEEPDSRGAAADLLEREGLVTIPGAFFGSAGEGYLRISYGAVAQDRLIEATGRIERWLAGRRGAEVGGANVLS